MTAPTAYRAAWVFPVVGPPLRDGVIEVDAAGDVVAVRPGPDREAFDLGPVAVVSGFVNAHVHLEFSDLDAPIAPPMPFPAWVRNVVAHRRERSGPAGPIIRRGLAESGRTGTAALGEIATADLPLETYAGGPATVLFRELIGPQPEAWPDLLAAAERHLRGGEPGPSDTSGVRFGLSPHAPYTVPQDLFVRTLALAAAHRAPVAVHLAETAAERDLFSTGTGELVGMMRTLGLWRPDLNPPGRRPLDWLRLLADVPRALVVHGNYLDDEELDFVAAAPNLTLVYCPRTHAYFGHPPHPFRRLLERGGRVALGTDGRSSNLDLDLWAEATFLRRRHPDLSCDTILDLVTRSGAEALGLSDRFGALAPGRRADFAVIGPIDPATDGPPDLFAPGRGVTRTFRGGVETT